MAVLRCGRERLARESETLLDRRRLAAIERRAKRPRNDRPFVPLLLGDRREEREPPVRLGRERRRTSLGLGGLGQVVERGDQCPTGRERRAERRRRRAYHAS